MTVHISNPIIEKLQLQLEQNTPRFPREELCSFVKGFFARRSEFIDLLEQYPPPLYILETAVLKERSRTFQAAFRQYIPDSGFYYAVKSNNHPDVAGTLAETGMGLDVSSGVELEMALKTGSRDIVFSGPGKTDDELRLAMRNADRVTLLIDSFGELARLRSIAGREGGTIRAGVRLTTNPSGLWRKFGILPEQLHQFWKEVQRVPNVLFQGLQFHTSWNMEPGAQIAFISKLGIVLAELPAQALGQIRFIDIGGGYWPPQGEWLQPAGTRAGMLKKSLGLEPGAADEHYRIPSCSIDRFAEQIGDAVGKYLHSVVPCRICVEPGRWLCNDAMHLLLSVVDRKGDDLVITDAGTSAVGWERFEIDYFPVLNLSRPALDEKKCHVLGSLCTPHDVWGYSYWGEDIRVGDILMIPTQGAYTYSLRQHFIKALPRVVTI